MSDKIKKRERGANYTQEEKTLLLDLIMQYQHIIEDKTTGGTIINKKREAWREIMLRYNSNCTTGPRQADQLKALYDNMKQKSRKNIGENKKMEYITKQNIVSKEDVERAIKNAKDDKVQKHKTGGGFWTPKTSDNDAKILAIIRDQVEPLSNPYDSGAIYFKDVIHIQESSSNEILLPVATKTTEADTGNTVLYRDPGEGNNMILEAEIHSNNNACIIPIPEKENADIIALQHTPSMKMTPSRIITPAQRKLINKECRRKVKKPKPAEELKRIYFKKKVENAYLERKKLMHEILQQRKEHQLKMLILKRKLEKINKD